MLQEKGLKSLLPRTLNQDPVENMFGAVRCLSYRNPMCGSFISCYKTLMLNNLISPHSPGANCEEDFTEGSLTNYKNLFSSKNIVNSCLTTLTADLPIAVLQKLNNTTKNLRQVTHTYIAGYIAKKINNDFLKDCKNCLTKICTDQLSNDHNLISVREYQSTRPTLKYPTTSFRTSITEIITYINNVLPSICLHQEIQLLLLKYIKSNFDLSTLCCVDHYNMFIDKILKCIITMFIRHWCVEVNKILSGKRTMRFNENDPIKIHANNWYKSHSKKKTIQGKFNQI